MRQAEVWIGGYYRTKVGNRITRVKVERNVGKRGRSRDQFECVTADTGKVILRTAAKLRPLVDVAKPAPVKRELVAYPDPDGIRTAVYIDNPQPVRGMIANVSNGPIVMVGVFDGFDRIVRTAVDRVHVAESWRVVAWAIRHRIREMYRPSSLPRALRRGLLYAAAKRHAANRQTYRMVMGEAPFPTEEMIGRAILGTQADRDRLLRHVDELRAG